jgi:ketosteroid isomerase-like protein
MSEENMALMAWLIDAFNSRDIEGFTSRCHPDLEWVPALITRAEGGPESTYRGIEGFRRWIAETDEVMAEFQVQPEVYRDVGDDRVLLLGTIVGKGRQSGADVHAELGQVFTFRDGQLVSYRGYLDRAEALEAVGLSE